MKVLWPERKRGSSGGTVMNVAMRDKSSSLSLHSTTPLDRREIWHMRRIDPRLLVQVCGKTELSGPLSR